MYYIYKLLGRNREVLYVGKTNNLKRRIKEHYKKQPWIKEVETVEYAVCEDQFSQDFYEKKYIKQFFPKYNKQENFSYSNIKVQDLEFKKYDTEDELTHDKVLQERFMFLFNNWNLVKDIFDILKEKFLNISEVNDIEDIDLCILQTLLEELFGKERNK